jgi:hypothetical protein
MANDRPAVLYLGTEQGLVRARREGSRWRADRLGPDTLRVSAVATAPDDPNRIYLATRNAGMLRSDNCGHSFRRINDGLLHKDVWSIAVHRRTGTLYVGTEPPRIYRADDGEHFTDCAALCALEDSAHWTFPVPPHLAHVRGIALHDADPDLVFAAIEEGWVARSRDGGRSWETCKQFAGGGGFDAHAVIVMPDDPRTVLVATGEGLFRSDHGGDRFTHSGSGMAGTYVTALAVHPARPDILYAGAADAPPPFWSKRHEGANAAFYRSNDRGRTWHRLRGHAALVAAPRSIALDPDAPEHVLFGMTDGSLWETTDDGRSFARVLQGLPGAIATVALGQGPLPAPDYDDWLQA